MTISARREPIANWLALRVVHGLCRQMLAASGKQADAMRAGSIRSAQCQPRGWGREIESSSSYLAPRSPR